MAFHATDRGSPVAGDPDNEGHAPPSDYGESLRRARAARTIRAKKSLTERALNTPRRLRESPGSMRHRAPCGSLDRVNRTGIHRPAWALSRRLRGERGRDARRCPAIDLLKRDAVAGRRAVLRMDSWKKASYSICPSSAPHSRRLPVDPHGSGVLLPDGVRTGPLTSRDAGRRLLVSRPGARRLPLKPGAADAPEQTHVPRRLSPCREPGQARDRVP